MTRDIETENRYDAIIDHAAREILKPDRSEARIFESIITAMCLDDDTNSAQTALRWVLDGLQLAVAEWAASDRPFDPHDYPGELSEANNKALEILRNLRNFAWPDASRTAPKKPVPSKRKRRLWRGGAAK